MIEWIVIMFVPILFWIGNSLANIAIGIKVLETRVKDLMMVDLRRERKKLKPKYMIPVKRQ